MDLNLNFNMSESHDLKDSYELVVIGGGPAAYSAAIYTSRARIETLLFQGPKPGGQLGITDKIENFAGVIGSPSGMEVAATMQKQAESFGTIISAQTVLSLEKAGDGKFIIKTDKSATITARSVIVATGTEPRKMGVPGEEPYLGRGISFCATCDAPFFKNKDCIVVGGGDSAVKEAMHLAKFAANVTIVHRRDELRAEKIIQEEAFKHPGLKFKWNSIVTEVKGDNMGVTGVTLKSTVDDSFEEMSVHGVFIFIGSDPKVGFMKDDLVELDKMGRVITDQDMKTSTPGLFAAGDVRAKSFKQVATAVGDGAVAAFSAQNYLEGH